jgi:hypothetical protein
MRPKLGATPRGCHTQGLPHPGAATPRGCRWYLLNFAVDFQSVGYGLKWLGLSFASYTNSRSENVG